MSCRQDAYTIIPEPNPPPNTPPKESKSLQQALLELIKTERSYIRTLECLACGARLLEQNVPSMQPVTRRAIFPNVEDLLILHRTLLQRIVEDGVSVAFLELVPFLKLYRTYTTGLSEATRLVEEWTELDKDFAKFREDQEKMAGTRLGLAALMLEPIQRPPRYLMLLSQILKFTPKTCVSAPQLQTAVDHVAVEVLWINEAVRASETGKKVIDLQRRLVLPQDQPRVLVLNSLAPIPAAIAPSLPCLVKPGRTFIGSEEIVERSSRLGGKPAKLSANRRVSVSAVSPFHC
jgi:hypothetical protein